MIMKLKEYMYWYGLTCGIKNLLFWKNNEKEMLKAVLKQDSDINTVQLWFSLLLLDI